MLAHIVFVCFHNSHSCKTQIVKRAVVASTTKSIQTINHHWIHFWHVGLYLFMNKTSQLSGVTIYFSPNGSASPSKSFTFIGWGWFRKNPEIAIANYAINPFNITNHVVVQDSNNLPIVFLRILSQASTAK